MVSLSDSSLKYWQEKDLEHLRYEYDLKPSDYVLDLGSYRREWASEIIRRYGCKVECFDALDNKAAWVRDGKIKMGGAFYYTSAFEEAHTAYDCVDIAPYLQSEVALCKINIEGGEYELLKYIIKKGLHKNIKNIQVQFHIVDSFDYVAAYNEIEKDLLKTHSKTWSYPFCWESWRRND